MLSPSVQSTLSGNDLYMTVVKMCFSSNRDEFIPATYISYVFIIIHYRMARTSTHSAIPTT